MCFESEQRATRVNNSGSCVTYGLLWGLSIVNILWPSCCTSCLSMGQRKRIREAYNLKGSDCKSCCFSFWGPWCEVGQTKLELNARAGQPVIVRPKQMAPPGVQQMSSPPPRCRQECLHPRRQGKSARLCKLLVGGTVCKPARSSLALTGHDLRYFEKEFRVVPEPADMGQTAELCDRSEHPPAQGRAPEAGGDG